VLIQFSIKIPLDLSAYQSVHVS